MLEVGIVVAISSVVTTLFNGLLVLAYKSKCNKLQFCCLSFERDLEMEYDLDIETIHYKNVKPFSVGSLISYTSKRSKSSKDENNVSVDASYTDFKTFFKDEKYSHKDFSPTLDVIKAEMEQKSSNGSNKTKSI